MQDIGMVARLTTLTIVFATFLATPAGANTTASALHAGDIFEIVSAYDTQNNTSDDSGSGSARGSDAMVVRVISIDDDGTVFELDHPASTSEQDRQRDWILPARVIRPLDGPPRLLNAGELDARLNDWLARANWTRDQCGTWIFTWNAFKIECDPANVLAALDEWFPPVPAAGEPYSHPLASIAVPLAAPGATSTNHSLAAVMPVDPARVRAARVEQDAIVREISGPNFAGLPDRRRNDDVISGTISVTFDIAPDGSRLQRIIVTRIETRQPDGVIETDMERTTLTRRRVGS